MTEHTHTHTKVPKQPAVIQGCFYQLLGPGGRTSLWDADVLTGGACPAHLPSPTLFLTSSSSRVHPGRQTLLLLAASITNRVSVGGVKPAPDHQQSQVELSLLVRSKGRACEHQWGQVHSTLRCRQLFLTLKIYPPDLSTKASERHSLRWNLTISLER